MSKLSSDMPWVIFHLLKEQFAVSANHVREMVAMPNINEIPDTSEYIRGVVNLRGHVLSVMDLRLRMGMKSIRNESEELIQLLLKREQEHKNWIAELEASVNERRKFTLATNPHKCAFGKWYDNFKTDNRVLKSCLVKFNNPHQVIHGIAIKVKKLQEKDDFEGALDIINETKEGALAIMIGLFAEIRALLKDSINEIAIILESDDKTMVISVDSVVAVEIIAGANIEEMPQTILTNKNDCIAGIGKWGEKKELVQLINVSNLINQEEDLINDVAENV